MSVGTEPIDIQILPQMIINSQYMSLLQELEMTDFEKVFSFSGGQTIKRIKARTVIRIETIRNMQSQVFYLKRHFSARPTLSELMGNFFFNRSISPGIGEFENICEFRRNGIATAAPVAAGQRRVGLLRYESFLITESFEPYVSLEKIIRNRPWMFEGKSGKDLKSRIIKSVALLARQMHTAGFNHRDFNATHVLISPKDDSGNVSLALFDLQRLDRKKWMRFRWMIKTLAELNYSMPPPQFSDKDLNDLYMVYRGIKKRRILDQFLLYWISRKTKKIGRHTQKIMRYRNSAGEIKKSNS